MAQPNYGIDAPGVVRNLFALSFLIGVATFVLTHVNPAITFPLFPTLSVTKYGYGIAAFLFVVGLLMLASSLWGKIKQRNKIFDLLHLQGNEHVLDVGCGQGLMLIGAAERVTSGRAVGIDIWQEDDLSGNTKKNAEKNAEIAGVADQVEIRTADAREIPFTDDSFDLVVSNLVIHNLRKKDERRKALLEMIRVLKPGGTLLIQDYRHIREYKKALTQEGFKDIQVSRPQFLIFPPVRYLRAVK